MHRKIYDWTIHWARTPQAAKALSLLAFAESSFFPVPPDILLLALAVGALIALTTGFGPRQIAHLIRSDRDAGRLPRVLSLATERPGIDAQRN